MLKNSRVTGALDVVRLGNALARPGMDTRIWTSLAIVTKVVVDPEEGVFCDVTLMPSRLAETARLGAEYAGNGFGLYCPVEVDDEVLVEAPSGDPDHGLVISRRLHSAADPPPPGASANPADVLLHVKQDRSVRVVVKGAGKVVIACDDGGQVQLGGEAASRGAARRGDTVGLTGAFGITDLQTMLDTRYAVASPTVNLVPGTTIGEVTSSSAKVSVE